MDWWDLRWGGEEKRGGGKEGWGKRHRVGTMQGVFWDWNLNLKGF